MATPRFTMVVLLVEDLARSLAFYRRLGMVFPPDADSRRDLQLDIGDGRHFVWTTTFVRNLPDQQPSSGGSRMMLEFDIRYRTCAISFATLLKAPPSTRSVTRSIVE